MVLPVRPYAQSFNLIRDTEIENAVVEWFTPIMHAAGMKGDSVNVMLVNDDSLNAFVAGGNNISSIQDF